ncbi:hypothetical protein EYF80_051861 [Liparis tanakae]|uniref:Uncharacterized protein n=1 Tax=Liparis tanakae TaxID=230148 RepID=A0A4Z2FC63_9TELE|nr:hypothetical protein EYF80_051861 [Liparis tanakae]
MMCERLIWDPGEEAVLTGEAHNENEGQGAPREMWDEPKCPELKKHQGGADAQLLQLLHQVPVLVHLQQDVAAAHKLTAQVHLRDRGPVGEQLDSCGTEPTSVLSLLQTAGGPRPLVLLHGADKTPPGPVRQAGDYRPSSTPCMRRIWTTALLKPHMGCAGVPFMNTTTLSFFTISPRSFWKSAAAHRNRADDPSVRRGSCAAAPVRRHLAVALRKVFMVSGERDLYILSDNVEESVRAASEQAGVSVTRPTDMKRFDDVKGRDLNADWTAGPKQKLTALPLVERRVIIITYTR